MKRSAICLLLPILFAGCAQVPEKSTSQQLNSSAQVAIPSDATIVTGTAIVKGQQPYHSANFSSNGQQLVYVSQNQLGPAIYMTNREQAIWSAPELVVSLQSHIVELPGLHFSRFMTQSNDQPSVAAGRVAFLAKLNNGAKGLFYAPKNRGCLAGAPRSDDRKPCPCRRQ
ncbi:hypothetical protein [Piscirickettsia litoralis]|uniref:hypothetical protein n=1 Tax=Piscirickettsia litoralis TaxID=1891921 RepID=UPI001F389119|nr:hypothetical protein [Piscirickettsia litoralis]